MNIQERSHIEPQDFTAVPIKMGAYRQKAAGKRYEEDDLVVVSSEQDLVAVLERLQEQICPLVSRIIQAEIEQFVSDNHISLRDILPGQSRQVSGLEFYRVSPEDTELIEQGYTANRLVVKEEGNPGRTGYADWGGHTHPEDDLPCSQQPHISDVVRYVWLTLLQNMAIAGPNGHGLETNPTLSLEQYWDEEFM